MTPWYLKILQELCDHREATITVTHTAVTCEKTELRCSGCGLVICSILEC